MFAYAAANLLNTRYSGASSTNFGSYDGHFAIIVLLIPFTTICRVQPVDLLLQKSICELPVAVWRPNTILKR